MSVVVIQEPEAIAAAKTNQSPHAAHMHQEVFGAVLILEGRLDPLFGTGGQATMKRQQPKGLYALEIRTLRGRIVRKPLVQLLKIPFCFWIEMQTPSKRLVNP